MRYAIIETNSGYVWWWGGDAEDALGACYAADDEVGPRPVAGHYEEISAHEARTTEGAYDVREVPDGFDLTDGTDRYEIARVEALPRAGFFRFVEDDAA